MGTPKIRCRLEEIALSKLEERGWTVTGGERRGLDLDLAVEFEGTRGRFPVGQDGPLSVDRRRL